MKISIMKYLRNELSAMAETLKWRCHYYFIIVTCHDGDISHNCGSSLTLVGDDNDHVHSVVMDDQNIAAVKEDDNAIVISTRPQ